MSFQEFSKVAVIYIYIYMYLQAVSNPLDGFVYGWKLHNSEALSP